MRYDKLATTTKKHIRFVVETPRGSTAKLSYDPATRAFEYTRPLPVGTVYPYDWGFIPSTQGADGDPLDGLVIHQGATAPGVVIKCDLLGCLAVEQRDANGTKTRNDRYVLSPHRVDGESESVVEDCVNERLRGEIENFFETAVLNTGKSVVFKGWRNAAEARRLIRKGQKVFHRA